MLAPLRVLVGALLTAVVVIAVAMAIPLGTETDALDPTPLLAVPLVGAVVALGLSETVGYRHPALAPGLAPEAARQKSIAAYSSGLFLRFALCEAVLLVSIGLAFAVQRGGYLTVLLAAVLSFALVWFECWPRERPIARSQAALEREGGLSYLRETYGLGTDTVIREL